MPYDYTARLEAGNHERCPEFRGAAAAVTYDSTGLRFPEELGPSSENPGQDYGSPGRPTIGAIEPLLPPEVRDRENREREQRNALRERVEQAAMAAAASALEGQLLSAQVFADVDQAVERAVLAAPEPAPEPAAASTGKKAS